MTTETFTRNALLQAREAKEDIVANNGIGSELTPAVYAWNDTGHGIAILMQAATDPADEHRRIAAAVMAFADGMAVHTATIIKEGYAAQRGTEDDPRPLAVRFAQGDTSVHECVTAVTSNTEGKATFAIQPYTVGLGRKVEWHDTLDLVNAPSILIPAASTIMSALVPDTSTSIEQALESLDELGFAALWCHQPGT